MFEFDGTILKAFPFKGPAGVPSHTIMLFKIVPGAQVRGGGGGVKGMETASGAARGGRTISPPVMRYNQLPVWCALEQQAQRVSKACTEVLCEWKSQKSDRCA